MPDCTPFPRPPGTARARRAAVSARTVRTPRASAAPPKAGPPRQRKGAP